MKYTLTIVTALIMLFSMQLSAATITIINKSEDFYSGKASQDIEKAKTNGFFITHVMASGDYFVIIMEKQ